MKARVEIYYFGCCPYSYFFAYDGGFVDETWTRTGGDFKDELKKLGIEVAEYNMLENADLVNSLDLKIDPFNPFSSFTKFLIDNKEASKEKFFNEVRNASGEKELENRDQRRYSSEYR